MDRIEKRRNVAAGESWELVLLNALKPGADSVTKVPVGVCAREGDIHASIGGTSYAFEVQVA